MQLTNCESPVYLTSRESFEFYIDLALFLREFHELNTNFVFITAL